MALTMPAKYEADRLNMRAKRVAVLALTDGTDTWYFGTQEMNLTDGHVYQGLQAFSEIESGADIYSKRWQVPNVTFTIANYVFTREDSADSFLRPSDVLTGLRGEFASLYLFVGDRITSLSDGLERFRGIVQADPTFTKTRLQVKVVSDLLYNDRLLPEETLGEIWPGAPFPYEYYKADPGQAAKVAPLAWGRYVCERYVNDELTVGGARAERVVGRAYCVSRHAWTAWDNADYAGWYKLPELPDVCQGLSSLADLNGGTYDDGCAMWTHLISTGGVYEAWIRLRPKDNWTGDYTATVDDADVNDLNNAIDRNPDSYAEVLDSTDTGSGSSDYMAGAAMFSWDDYAAGSALSGPPGVPILSSSWQLSVVGEFVGAAAFFTSAWARIYYGVSGGDQYVSLGNFTPSTSRAEHTFSLSPLLSAISMTNHWLWHLRSGDDQNGGEAWPLTVRLFAQTDTNSATGDPDADGMALNQWLFRIYDICLDLGFNMATQPDEAYVEGEARPYGSWISSRSSNYTAGDCITDPAGIVESLLRDVLGFTSSQIDQPSFINAENTSVDMRVNLHEEFKQRASDLIRMIAEQSTFLFVWGPVGQARLIDLTDKTPTVDHTIPFSHVRDGDVEISKTTIVRDTLVISSRWRQEFGAYQDNNASDPVVDATADGLIYTAAWRFLAGTSVDTVAALYVNSTDGIWSKVHNIVKFETVGFTWAHVQEGDWCALDSETWDPQLLAPGGASWSGKKLLVTNASQGADSTKLTMIELWS